MRIEALHLEGFRNIQKFSFTPCPGANVVYGENAQGKTNLLEAVWLFSGLRSFRNAREADFISFDAQRAILRLEFYAQGRPQNASIAFEQGKKAVYLNGVKKERVSAFIGVFSAVVFSPDHLSLIKSDPEGRRKMIDTSLCQSSSKYGKVLNSYEKALKQRNRLLKDLPLHASLLDTLEVWDHHLVEYGAYLSQMRARYITKLSAFAAEAYDGVSHGREVFSAVYRPSFGEETQGFELQDCRERLQEALKQARANDLRTGSTSVGPHRDDMEVGVSGQSARFFASQGQQRSCILALKLAECRILEERFGEPPLILLDDVMSELDSARRSYLLGQLSTRQALITCCDTSAFQSLSEGKIFHIHAGALLEN